MKKIYCLGFFFLAFFALLKPASAQTDDLMIVEFVDESAGTGWAIKIYNPTNATIDLTNYCVCVWNNSTAFNGCDALSGNILPGQSLVAANNGYSCASDISFTASSVNGNDAIVLKRNSCINDKVAGNVDMIGSPNTPYGNNTSFFVGGVADGLAQRKIVRNFDNCQRYTDVNGANFDNQDGSVTAGWSLDINDDHTGWASVASACLTSGVGGTGQFAGLDTCTADAGADQSICVDNITLTGTALCEGLPATGSWSFVSGPAAAAINAASGAVTGMAAPGVYEFEFCADPVTCSISECDTVLVTVNSVPTVDAGPDATICVGGSATFDGAAGLADYDWTPAASLDDPAIEDPTATPATTTTYTLVGENAAGCTNSATVTVTVDPLPTVDAGLDAAICIGESAQLDGTNGLADYDWTPAATLDDPAIEDPTATPAVNTTYTLTGEDANGCTNSATVTVTVNPLPTVDAGPDQTICLGESATLDGTNGLAVYDWTPAATLDDPAIEDPTATPTVNTTYTLNGTDGNGCTNSATVTVTVDPAPEAGTLSAAGNTVCEGDNASLTLAGSSADALEWYEDIGCSGTFNPLPAFDDLTTANPVPVPAQTCYRVIASLAGCTVEDTVEIQIDATPVSEGGTVSAPPALVCEGDQVNLSLTGSVGGTIRWQRDLDCDGGFVNFDPSLDDQTNVSFPAPAGVYCYRASVQNTALCATALSDTVQQEADAQPQVGSITGNLFTCAGDSVGVTVSSFTGDLVWEEDPGCTGTFFLIPMSDNLTPIRLAPTDTTCYRARVSNGICPDVFSPTMTISPAPRPSVGTTNGDQTVCIGESADLELSSFEGDLIWEIDPGCVDNYAFLSGSSNQNPFTVTPTGALTCYRATASNAFCPPAIATRIRVEVDQIPDAGTLSLSADTLCIGETLDLNLAGSMGSTITWEEDPGCIDTWTVFATTGTAQTVTPAVGDGCYRAIVGQGVCPNDTSNVVQVFVVEEPIPGNLSVAPAVVCETAPITVDLTGNTGNQIRWQVDFGCDGGYGEYTTFIDQTSITVNRPPGTHCFRARVRNSDFCDWAFSDTVQVDVDPEPLVGVAAPDATICQGDNAGLFVSFFSGDDISWEEDPGCSGTFGPLAGSAGQNPFFITPAATACYRAAVTSGICAPALSATIQITVDDPTVLGTLDVSADTLCEGEAVDMEITGFTADTIRWEEQFNCNGSWVLLPGSANQSVYTYTTPVGRHCYRVRAQNGACLWEADSFEVFTFDETESGGLVAVNTTLCETEDAVIELVGNVGATILWERQPGCAGPFAVFPGFDDQNIITFGQPADTICYRARVQNSPFCAEEITDTIQIITDPETDMGTLALTDTVCENDPVDASLSGYTADQFEWQVEPFCSGGYGPLTAFDDQDALSEVFPVGRHCYLVRARSGVCGWDTILFEAEVVPQTVAGMITQNTNRVCQGDSVDFTLSGNVGGEIRWQQDAGCDGIFADLGQYADLVAPRIQVTFLDTNCYRALVRNTFACPWLPTDTLQVTVDEATVAGTVVVDRTALCEDTSFTAEVSGYRADQILWQERLGCAGPWNTLNMFTNLDSITYAPPVGDHCYRLRRQNGVCPPEDTVINISVLPASDAGLLTVDLPTVCVGEVAELTLANNIGSSIQWFEDAGCAGAFAGPLVPLADQTTAPFTQLFGPNNCYRVVVQNTNLCATDTGNIVVVNVQDPPTVSPNLNGAATICQGDTTSLTLDAFDGFLLWEKDENCDGGFVPMNATANQDSIGVSPQTTTCYRAVVARGICPSAVTDTIEVTVDMPSVAGTIAGGGQRICEGDDFGDLTLNGFSGDILGWESSTDDFATVNPLPGTAATTVLPGFALTDTTCFRARVQNGVCPEDTTLATCIFPLPPPVGGAVGNDTLVCIEGHSVTLNLTGETGRIIRWESTTGASFAAGPVTTIANMDNDYLIENLTVETRFRAVVKTPLCPETFSDPAVISIEDAAVPGFIVSNDTICRGTGSVTLNLFGSVGNVVEWQSSIFGFAPGSPFNTVPGSAGQTSITLNNLAQTTQVRASVDNGVCPAKLSATAEIVTLDPVPPVVTAPGVICENTPAPISANGPGVGTAAWSCVNATGGGDCLEVFFSNAGGTQAVMIISRPGTYTLRRTHDGIADCPPETEDFSVEVRPRTPQANAGADQTVCAGTATLAAGAAPNAQGFWTLVSGGGIFANQSDPNTTVTNLQPGFNLFRWTLNSPPCAPTFDEVVIERILDPTPADAGPDRSICNASTIRLQGGPVFQGAPDWDFVSGPATPNLSASGNALNISGMTLPGDYEFEMIVTNPPCAESRDTVVVSVSETPDAPGGLAGAFIVCEGATETYSVTADPNVDTYDWQTVPSGPTVVSAGATADITWPSAGSFILRITPSNACGVGPTISRAVTVEAPPVADAGADRIVCGPNAVVRGFPVGGTWNCAACPAPGFVNTLSNGLGLAGALEPGQDYVFEYEFPAGVCPASTDQVVVRNERAVPGVVSGGTTVCAGGTAMLTLTNFTGTILRWEKSEDGGATYLPINKTTTSITETVTTRTLFRAIVQIDPAANNCAPQTSTLAVVEIAPVATASVLNAPSTVCVETAQVLAAPLPNGVTGTWSYAGGPSVNAQIVTAGTAGIVTGMDLAGVYEFEWTATSGGNCPPAVASVLIERLDAAPDAEAGPNQTICGDAATVNGNNPTPGTGSWKQTSGPVTATITPTSPTEADISDLTADGVYYFEYEIDNGQCGKTTDRLAIIRQPNTVTADAGPDQTVCGQTALLRAANPTPNTGIWTIRRAPAGASALTTSAGTIGIATNLSVPGEYVFDWTVTGGNCNTTAVDSAKVIVLGQVSAAVAVPVVEVCDTSRATLQAVTPTAGTGVWSFVSGPSLASVATAGTQGDVFGMSAPGEYTFRWTVSGPCNTASALVRVLRDFRAPRAYAGEDQELCNTPQVLLVGNMPMPPNKFLTGEWFYTGGVSVNPNIATFGGKFGVVSGMTDPGTYNFRYELRSLYGICPASVDSVTVTRFDPPSAANDIGDEVICADNITLTGNAPAVGSPEWRFVGGPLQPSLNPNGTTLDVTGMTAPGIYRFQYLITSGPCAPSADGIAVQVDAPSDAGFLSASQTICKGETAAPLNLSGTTGATTGWETSPDAQTWTPAGAGGGLTFGPGAVLQPAYYRAIVQNGVCPPDTSGFVFIDTTSAPQAGIVGPLTQTICAGAAATPLTLTGFGNSPVARWEVAFNCDSAWQPLGATVPTLTPNAAATGRACYRAVTGSAACGFANSNIAEVVVSPGSAGGFLQGGQTVCQSSFRPLLALSGFSGQIIKWESSVNGGQSWTGIAYTQSLFSPGTLSQTTQFRVIVQLGNCPPDTSNIAEIALSAPSVGGQVTVSQQVCPGEIPDPLVLQNHIGVIEGWEVSTNGGASWQGIGNSGRDSLAFFAPLTGPALYRARIRNANCPVAISSFASLTLAPAPSLTATAALSCSGASIQAQGGGFDGSLTYAITPADAPANGSGAFANLTPGGFYVVSATNLQGCVTSQPVTIPSGLPAPVIIQGSTIPGIGALIDWADVQGAVYELRWREAGNLTWNAEPVPIYGSQYFIPGLQPGVSYEFEVRAYCLETPGIESPYSQTFTYRVEAGKVAASAEPELRGLTVYPNPNAGAFVAAFAAAEAGEIDAALYDLQGRKVWKQSFAANAGENELRVAAELAAGVYLLELRATNGRQTVKVVID